MKDASKIAAVADDVTDVIGAASEGLRLCSECHHFYDPRTGATSEKYKGVYVVRVGGDKVCQPCIDSLKWPDR